MMAYSSFLPLRAPEQQWLIEAETIGQDVPMWTRIAVLAPTSSAALQLATDALGSELRIIRRGMGPEHNLDEEAELLSRLEGDRRIVWAPPRPTRVRDTELSGRLSIESTLPPTPDLQGFELLPEVIRNAGGQIYMVLDGASVFGLVERLESSGLVWRCLFQGDAVETYADAAPYLIELRPDNRLASKLLRLVRSKDAADQTSALNSGIFLSSSVSLDGLRRHLRKFTMLESETQGKRAYFRFYDPLIFRTLITNLAQDDLASFCTGIDAVGAVNADGGFTTIFWQGTMK